MENDRFRIHNPLDITDLPVPVLLAALGPVMLRIAGERADGTVLWMADERAIADHVVPGSPRRPRARAGPRRASSPGSRCACARPTRWTARSSAANQALGHAEYSPNYQRLLEQGDASDVGDMAALGTEADIERRLGSYDDAGTTDFSARILPLGNGRDEIVASVPSDARVPGVAGARAHVSETVRGDLLWRSLPAMAADAAARFGDAEAVVDGDRRVSYTELVADARRVTAALVASGIDAGDRVAIWSPNRYEWLVAALGTLGAGAAVVPVNTRFKGEEARYILERSGARVVFTVGEFLGMDYAATVADLRPDLPNLRSVVGFDDPSKADHSLDAFCRLGSDIDAAAVDARWRAVQPDDVSDVLFTSGTTGAPKGVLMTHAQTLRQFSDWCDMAGLRTGDRYLIVNPFFHMFGYKAGCLASLMQGATIIPKPVLEVDDLLRTVTEEAVTVLPGPPTLYQSILDHPGLDAFDLSSLRVAVTGAADIPVELIRRLHEELPFSTIITGYGLTEGGTVTGTGPDDDFETIATTVGRARPGLEIRIADDDGTAQPVGQPGEVLVPGLQRDARVPRRPGRDGASDRPRQVGCTPATSARSTNAAASASSVARRTCSSSGASTPTRPRSRTCCSATPRSAGSRWWACPTSASARSAWPSSWRRPARRSNRTSSSSGRAPRWRTTRCPEQSRSSMIFR